MKRCGLLALLFVLFASGIPAGQAALDPSKISPQGLSPDQAELVLRVVLKHLPYDLNKEGMYIEALHKKDGTDPHPGYYDFGLSYDSPAEGATEALATYAVSRFTGDVWEVNLCKRYSQSDLKKLQKIIMARTGRSFASEKKERIGLGCSNG
ncbi:MAG: hypothetical protein WAM04_11800 [Candidatus Sulfotelmatobacter sp.]